MSIQVWVEWITTDIKKQFVYTRMSLKSGLWKVCYLVEAGVVEHVLAPALDDGSVAGDVAVGGQHLQAVTAERDVTPINT